MNKNTKRLIEECSGRSRRTVLQPENIFREGILPKYDIDVELLVETVVKECAEISDKAWNDPGTYPGNLVRKHFGIKS